MLAIVHVILALLALTACLPLLAPQWSFFGTQRTELASSLARGASGSAASVRCAVLLMAQGADAKAQRCRGECFLCTVTYYANLAHSLTRSP